MGNAPDLWTVCREHAYWLAASLSGVLLYVGELCESQSSVKVSELHFNMFLEFVGASYYSLRTMARKTAINPNDAAKQSITLACPD